ncbi:MAG: substrate-binding domain-containing protein, partial [Planctomycetota bacterium]|nr:substrate-binding domain-containing protein [Planctomycetota bacterium]
LAVGALEALGELKIEVPNQVQVVGFDDQPLMDFVGLTTVHQPIAKLGRWAANAITRRLSKPRATPRSTVLPVELVARRTTKPVA